MSPGRPKKDGEKSSSNLNEISHIRTAAEVAKKIGVSLPKGAVTALFFLRSCLTDSGILKYLTAARYASV